MINIIYLLFAQLLLIHGLYFLAQKYHKGDLADFAWTCLVLSWGLFYFLHNSFETRNVIIFVLIFIWALRLGQLILFGRILKKGEDRRYQTLRTKWGVKAKSKFYLLFLAQILIAGILALPFRYIFNKIDFSFWDYLGLTIFFIGYQGVALADSQLAKFRSLGAEAGPVCNLGLWKYSRHPNYFFEWIIWLSYPIFIIGTSGFIISLISPLLMFLLLLFVTGVPPSEKQALATRGEAYRAYQQKTSKFFPWFESK